MKVNSTLALTDIIDFILNKVALHTKTPRDTLQADTSLAKVGVDSLIAVLLCGYLEDEYQLEIEPLIMFEYKTADQVANVIFKRVTSE
ncbi:acyl carrier protein [Pseudoalteromonas rhizosphaerae]|uniref:acyl carrier protein n=1 Tax=Pseudoalteromonas rhizosphaerae TaxID=2518973 RepID=UPI00214828CB|nr:acyl carrier protein [Pseudoalteromonas rhizosphaerae]